LCLPETIPSAEREDLPDPHADHCLLQGRQSHDSTRHQRRMRSPYHCPLHEMLPVLLEVPFFCTWYGSGRMHPENYPEKNTGRGTREASLKAPSTSGRGHVWIQNARPKLLEHLAFDIICQKYLCEEGKNPLHTASIDKSCHITPNSNKFRLHFSPMRAFCLSFQPSNCQV
jgi:hypothetical protein